uniref:F-box domain-containing protein n=1 Tax=Mycena chlorophos TaxID=658473 RepID=A0ABQ0LKX5_MYCCL|nr:predicted protein [Mycena chlorophos]
MDALIIATGFLQGLVQSYQQVAGPGLLPPLPLNLERYILRGFLSDDDSEQVLRTCSFISERLHHWAQLDFGHPSQTHAWRLFAGAILDSSPLLRNLGIRRVGEGPFLPPELERQIILHHVEGQDLAACSLVCVRMRYWSQSRLFHTIVFNSKPSPGSRNVDPETQAWRLLRIVESSPHLLLHIRNLSLQYSSAPLLAILSSREWPALEDLRLRYLPSVDEGCVPDIQRLVASPSLRSLELLFKPNAWNADYLTYILAHASRTLTTLSLKAYLEPQARHIPPSPLSRPSRNPSFILDRLDVISVPATLDVLAQPYFARCLSKVREMRYYHTLCETPHPLLNRIGRKLHSLEVESRDYSVANLAWAQMPLLTHLRCDLQHDTVVNILARLPPDNTLTTLTLTTTHQRWQAESLDQRGIGLQLDRVVAEKLPRLRVVCVEVTVIPRYRGITRIPRVDHARVTRELEAALPRLKGSGVLSIIFLRQEYPWWLSDFFRKLRLEKD